MSGGPVLSRPATDAWQSVHLLKHAPDVVALSQAGLHVAEIDGGSISGKEDLMDAVAAALEFPDYFGGNWDALDECLRDLGTWLPARGYVVVVAGAEGFWRRSPELAGMLVRTWLDASDVWVAKTTPFHLTFVS